MDIKNFKTLTGLTLAEAAIHLDAELPKDAYKAVPGAADLTDIDPNYMRKVLNEVFGLCGVGWGYKYAAQDMRTEVDVRQRSSGGTRKVYMATLMHLTFWYKTQGEDGAIFTSEIDASGGSENDVEGYAMKGAITNALGNASSNIGFQESVYLNKRSHKTVGGGGKSPAPKPAPVAKAAAPKPAPAAKVEAPKPAPVAKAAAPKPVPAVAPVPPAVDDPAKFVVKMGPRTGKSLSEIYAEGKAGHDAIQYYTKMATGNSAEKEALKNAAIGFLARHNGHVPQSVAA